MENAPGSLVEQLAADEQRARAAAAADTGEYIQALIDSDDEAALRLARVLRRTAADVERDVARAAALRAAMQHAAKGEAHRARLPELREKYQAARDALKKADEAMRQARREMMGADTNMHHRETEVARLRRELESSIAGAAGPAERAAPVPGVAAIGVGG